MDAANGVNYAVNASYAPHGALASVVHGQTGTFIGINLNLAYSNRLQPTTIGAWSTNGVALDLAYCFNATVADFTQAYGIAPVQNNGNVARITNNLTADRSQRFTYDELNRVKTALTQATTGTYAWGLSFGYDIWANLLSATVTQGSAPMLSVSALSNNRLSGYSYDAAGNMLGDGSSSYTYDAENRLKTGAGVTYTYDGDGKRVQKSTGKLYWYGMGSEVLLETDSAGNITDEFIFFGGRRIARRDNSGGVYYFFADHLGSARVATNASGTIVEDSDFYPFGAERIVVDSLDNQYKFTGKERDAETGLDCFGARYDSSSLGRFMSVDPSRLSVDLLNPQTWNRYSYANNNPLAFVDRNGRWSTRVHNEIIDAVFRDILNESERQIFKDQSAWVDKTTQGPAESFKHGMGAPNEDPERAVADTNAWINENLQKAVSIELGAESAGHTGNDPGALAYFGVALHAETDSTSPWHRDARGNPLPWRGESIGNLPSAAWHGLREYVGGAVSESEAKYAAKVKAAFLWQRYQKMLEEARKKQEEQRKKKCQQEGKKHCD